MEYILHWDNKTSTYWLVTVQILLGDVPRLAKFEAEQARVQLHSTSFCPT